MFYIILQVLIFVAFWNIISNGDYMKKKLSFLLVMFLILAISGCGNKKEYPEPVIVLPNEDTAQNVNGYKIDSYNTNFLEKLEASKGKIFANSSTKKYHRKDCIYVKNMDEQKLVIFETEGDAFEGGYSACKKCIKE